MTNRNDGTSRNERNLKNIEEFRANAGQLGGNFAGSPVLLLTTTGAKTALERVNPLMYLPDGERWIVFATKGGSPTHPDWYHNLVANAKVVVEVGKERFEATAEVLTGDERDRTYAEHAALYPQFAAYEERTTRKIPALALTRGA